MNTMSEDDFKLPEDDDGMPPPPPQKKKKKPTQPPPPPQTQQQQQRPDEFGPQIGGGGGGGAWRLQQRGGDGLEDDSSNLPARRAYFVGHYYDKVAELAIDYARIHETFYQKTIRQYAVYVDRFRGLQKYEVIYSELFDEFEKLYVGIIEDFRRLMNALLADVVEYGLSSDDAAKDYSLQNVDEDRLKMIDAKKKRCFEILRSTPENITRLYKGEMSSVLPRFDAQFYVLAGLKLVGLGVASFSLSMASRIFEDQYLVQVYTQNAETPPSLYLFLAYFMGFDLAIHAGVFFVLWVLSYVRNLPSLPSVFDSTLLYRAIVDYVISRVLIAVVLLIVISVVVKKRYFRYDLEGPRAIRAVKEIAFYLAVVTTLLPIFALL